MSYFFLVVKLFVFLVFMRHQHRSEKRKKNEKIGKGMGDKKLKSESHVFFFSSFCRVSRFHSYIQYLVLLFSHHTFWCWCWVCVYHGGTSTCTDVIGENVMGEKGVLQSLLWAQTCIIYYGDGRHPFRTSEWQAITKRLFIYWEHTTRVLARRHTRKVKMFR